ncbi:MAG: hypothetical protein HN348_17880 [Proteobacteria bacterium]|jgi:hypothetical protein|nr:hypothetical protein [Pseudomonadota bacterium]
MAFALLMFAFLGCGMFSDEVVVTNAEGDLLGLLGADKPCMKYADYMCACHGETDGVHCKELRQIYENPDRDVREECLMELEMQKSRDLAEGLVCSDKEQPPG